MGGEVDGGPAVALEHGGHEATRGRGFVPSFLHTFAQRELLALVLQQQPVPGRSGGQSAEQPPAFTYLEA